jgi:hypothetical protein
MNKWMYTAPQRKIDSALLKKFPDQHKIRNQLREEIRQVKSQRRAEKIAATHRKKLWAVLLRDLNYEHNNVRQGMKYQTTQTQPERLHAFQQYLLVLDKVRDEIEAAQSNPEVPKPTPSAYTRWLNAKGKRKIPNNGSHWTDWVPSRIKAQVIDLFNAIPHVPKAKRKLPFQRTQRPQRNNPALTRLIQRTEKELGYAQQELDIAPTNPVFRLKVRQMQQALTRMQDMKPSEAVPHTWHGLFGAYDEAAIKAAKKELEDKLDVVKSTYSAAATAVNGSA